MTTLDIAQAIARYEGYKPGTRSYRNNNPGNLRYAGQRGATGADGQGFAIFSDAGAGWNALQRQIELDAGRGHTLASFLSKYAPSHENNTSAYLQTVAGWLGIRDPNTRLNDLVGSPSANPWEAATPAQAIAAAVLNDEGQLEPMTVAAVIVGAAALFTIL